MGRRSSPGLAAFWAGFLASAALAAAPAPMVRGDVAWERRAEGATDGRALPDPIGEAVAAYEAAVAAQPAGLEARWKLLRALHFAGEFTLADEAARSRGFERGRVLAEESLDVLARRAGDGERIDALPGEAAAARLEAAGVSLTDAARLHFWAAIHWGAWSRTVGLLQVVRQGVAGRLHRYAETALALEPGYEDGGALRLLGRLHATLPRVPFVSGWVDRDRAVPLIERARTLAPQHPGNRLLLALTLLDLAPARRDEALDLLRQVADAEPRPSQRIEDLAVRREARDELAELEGAA